MQLTIHRILPLALALFLPVLNLISNREFALPEQEPVEFVQRWVSSSVILYTSWYVLLWASKGGTQFKWSRIIPVALAVLAVFYLLLSVIFIDDGSFIRWNLIIKFVFAATLFLIIQYALQANTNISRLQLEKEQMQTQNYRVQLEALRAKVDPHFLFNSLNTLRTMVRHQHGQAEQFILSLSDFYRHTLKYNEETTIRLFEEVNVLKAYLFLMKSRKEDAVEIDLQIDERYEQYLIPTLALQAVVENCFKHNIMTSKSPLKIRIRPTEDFYIEVRNNVQPRLHGAEASGFGLKSIKRRYELLKIKDGVQVESNEEEFSVRLKLL